MLELTASDNALGRALSEAVNICNQTLCVWENLGKKQTPSHNAWGFVNDYLVSKETCKEPDLLLRL